MLTNQPGMRKVWNAAGDQATTAAGAPASSTATPCTCDKRKQVMCFVAGGVLGALITYFAMKK